MIRLDPSLIADATDLRGRGTDWLPLVLCVFGPAAIRIALQPARVCLGCGLCPPDVDDDAPLVLPARCSRVRRLFGWWCRRCYVTLRPGDWIHGLDADGRRCQFHGWEG